MIPAAFEYTRAEDVDHALEALSADPGAKLLAGGHSLLPLMKLRFARPSMLVDIGRLTELSYVERRDDHITIGALTRHHDLANDPVLQRDCPIVADAASTIGDPQVRHVGTIGGSLAHADPASDLPAVMLALEATFVIRSAGGTERLVPAGEFFKGLFTADLEHTEILTQVRVPVLSGGWSFIKFTRRAQDWALVGVAAVAGPQAVSVALANMGQTPIRARAVEARLAAGDAPAIAALQADQDTAPPSDAFGDAGYRRELAKVLVARALTEALG
ncbi:MAG: xanthine dehydrogenase family protein subunit M [Actinomycetota bacterium]